MHVFDRRFSAWFSGDISACAALLSGLSGAEKVARVLEGAGVTFIDESDDHGPGVMLRKARAK
jgi:hypothetical protein